MRLFTENGEPADILDIVAYWEYWYPSDVFIDKPILVVRIRELLSILKQAIYTKDQKLKQILQDGKPEEELWKRLNTITKEKFLTIIIKWRKYPEEKPNENESDLILLLKDGSINASVFYTAEDSSHDHSIWNQARAWIRYNDLKLGK